MSFSSILFQLSDSLLSGNGSTQSSEPTCENKIDFYLFYQLLVVPSVLEIGIMSLFVTRKRMCLHVCKGRPGVVTPMNIFEMENRFSFACAFGMIAYLIYQVVLESKYVIPFSGHVGYRDQKKELKNFCILQGFYLCFVAITATCVECVLSALILVHLTSSYRKYLLGLHKGDTVHIPPISEKSNVSLLLGSMRWAGYQVGYVAWGRYQWLL
ncbi:hypothetical protein KUTeg_012593 [Tegillarca granosa]|uniref:Uncharacterized protein n=1 Tax=Tegillarca granosa TaxID=220873 RepID=A0ABQ9F027_TEGGR|nr:hypothetical protein KUTeg_012593 [Tegillarca granosa]